MPRMLNADAIASEAHGEPVIVTIDAVEYKLPPDMPMEFLDALADGEPIEAMSVLVDEDFAEKLMDALGGVMALRAFMDQLVEAYGMDLGELEASSAYSGSNGSRSRRTSGGSTGGRSRKPATAKRK